MHLHSLFRKHWAIISLLIITLIGLFIRLYQLTWQCYTVDEVYTAQVAAYTTQSIIYYSFRYDCNLPLYYIIAHWVSVFAGTVDRFTVRIPAVIFGTLCIPVTYFIGKYIRSETLGLLAASAVAIMFPFFLYSQDGRAYTLVMLMFLCFIYFYIKIVEGDKSNTTIILAGLFAALALWSHYYAIVPIGIAIILLVLNNRKLPALEVAVITGTLISPMLFIMDIHNLLSRAAPGIFGASYTLGITPQVLTIHPLQMILYLPFELWCWTCLIIIPLAIYSLWKYKLKIFGYFAWISVGSIAGVVIVSCFTNTMPRYALLVSPLFIIMALYPVAEVITDRKLLSQRISLFLLAIFVIFLLNYPSILSWTSFNICPMVNGTYQFLPRVGVV
jgi:4-amino-4-deoxy-L-arabinose transferase-like glycosyltransferase